MLQRNSSAPSEPGVVASSVYAQGRRIADMPLNEAGDWSKRPGHVVWIGLFEPDPETLQRVQAQFNLHPLAIEDAGNAHQQPKIEQYGESLFIVARTAQMLESAYRLRRNAYLRRQGICGLGAPRRVGILCESARALRILPDNAVAWRGLHPLCDPRFHRRQLRAGVGGDQRRGRDDRGCDPQQDAGSREYRPALSTAARSSAAAQRGLRRCSMCASGSRIPRSLRSMRRCSRISAT